MEVSVSADHADADAECADCASLAGVAAEHWARAAEEGPDSLVSIDDMISAQRTAARLTHQEASVQRFLELNGDDFHATS